MCGLAGFYNFSRQKESNTNKIWDMIDLQKHRGPDDSAVFSLDSASSYSSLSTKRNSPLDTSCDLFFGFNRLSILDLSDNGRQPMLSEDGNVALMMNGEIYNAFDHQRVLNSKGHKFQSTSDTEVVLKLYLEYGMDGMIDMLNGMFAIVIWDMRIKTLFLARDRFGIKPLYFLQENERFAFSSELKSFQVLPDFTFRFDESKLDEFLVFRNVINDTLLKNIRNCPPGTYLSVGKSGSISEHRFHSLENEGNVPISSQESFSKLEKSLRESVSRQMISDVKLGCQLSGGVDSSIVTYFANKSLEEGQLETISIDFVNSLYSESKFIEQVTKKIELVAHKYFLNPDYYFKKIDSATWHFEQPLNHPNTIGIYLLSEQAKKHVTVLLSGEGADEILAGYDRFIDCIGSPFLKRSFFSKIKQNTSSLFSFLKNYIDDKNRLIMASSFTSTKIVNELYPEFEMDSALQKRKKILEGLTGNSLLKHRKYEILTYLPDLLMRQDKMSMAHSIENRVPFLDNEMVQTSLNILKENLINKWNGNIEGKLLLKRLCGEKLGNNFAFRKKQGFGIPLKDFMATDEFQTRWFDEIEPGIKARGIFCNEPVSNWVSNINNAEPVQLDAIWLMSGFEIWAKQFLDYQ